MNKTKTQIIVELAKSQSYMRYINCDSLKEFKEETEKAIAEEYKKYGYSEERSKEFAEVDADEKTERVIHEHLNSKKEEKLQREIISKGQLRVSFNNYQKKDMIYVMSAEVGFKNGKFRTTLKATGTTVGRVFTKNEVVRSVKIRDGKSIITLEDKFSFGFFSLTLSEESSKFAEALQGGTLYVVHHNNGWVQLFADLNRNGVYTNLETNTDVTELPKGQVYVYRGLAYTASNKRNLTMIFRNVTYVDDRFALLDRVSLGAMSILRDTYGLNPVNRIDLLKAFGYIGNVLTGSVNMGIVPGYIRYFGKFENSTTETFLTKVYARARKAYSDAIKSGNKEEIERTAKEFLGIKESKDILLTNVSTQDGQFYVNAAIFVKMLAEKFEEVVKEEVLVGEMNQARPATAKGSAIFEEEGVFWAKVEGMKRLMERKKKEIQKLISIAESEGDIETANKLQKDLEKCKYEIIGDPNNILYLVDANVIKLDYDMTQDVTFELLAFAKCSEGKLSKQIAESLLVLGQQVGVNAAQLIYNIIDLSIDNVIDPLTKGGKTRLLTPEEIEKAANDGFVTDICLATSPKFLKMHRAFFENSWSQAINTVTKIINKLSGDIVSHNRRLASDPVFLITGGKLRSILNTGEVFINSRRVTKVLMIKYPKMGLREFYFAKNVTLGQIIGRVDHFVNKAKRITRKEGDAIIQFYKTLSTTVAVLPAKSVITYACAGLDFDYDGALFIEFTKNPKTRIEKLTNELLSIFEQTKMKAVVIQ